MNGTTSEQSTASARKHYNSASRSFLVRDYASTASSLASASNSLPPSQPEEWIDALTHDQPVPPQADLKRRLDILQITFLATVHSSAPLSPAPHVTPLLDLAPDKLIKSLWSSLVEPESREPVEDIVPTSRVALVHPSVTTSLCLAALKVNQPKLARQIAESWIASTTEEMEKIAWQEVESMGEDWQSMFPIDGMGASAGMNGSSILKPRVGGGSSEAKEQFVKSWIKLLDLLVLHISPRLNEWEAAGDYIRLQSIENGGWVPDQRVEATLQRLKQIQQEETDSAAARIRRQKEVEAYKAAHKREARSSSKQDKGKGRARDDHSPTSSSGSTPEKKKRSPSQRNVAGNGTAKSNATNSSSSSSASSSHATSPTSALSPSLPTPNGFAGLRSSISSYLSRSNHETTTTRKPPSNPISTLASYLRHHYSTDPLRLLSIICFFFALTTYLRRRFSIQRGGVKTRRSLDFGVKNGMALILGKVGETLRMGTKVTTL